MKSGKRKKQNSIILNIRYLIQFLTHDIWRQNSANISNNRNILYNAIKTIILTIRNVYDQNLSFRSNSLTYRTILSIVPLLAVIFAIARGFGFENILKNELFHFVGDSESGLTVVNFINSSLEQSKGSVFAGIGIILLFYTVFSLFMDVEYSFNKIWQINTERSIHRRISDYFTIIILLPLFIVFNSGLSIFIKSSNFYGIDRFLGSFFTHIIDIIPLFIVILSFTCMYKFIPKTKVKLLNALIGGVVAGTAFQFFQMLYLNGQLWITKYNAIYGTFAAIPLLLLWLQVSWLIVLIGCSLSYSAQNITKFSFEKETKNISKRYYDFFTIIILNTIVKRFADAKDPFTKDRLSNHCKVPLKLTSSIIEDLLNMNIISSTNIRGDSKIKAYQPALDINILTVGYVMLQIDKKGSESFLVDRDNYYLNHWNALIESRKKMYDFGNNVLIKDL